MDAWALSASCWLDSQGSEIIGQIEPLGCHPDFRRYALGRLALAEGLRRMRAHGRQSDLCRNR